MSATEEYITGHLADAVLLPVDEISRAAAEKLAALGYSELYDLGGLGGWPYGLE